MPDLARSSHAEARLAALEERLAALEDARADVERKAQLAAAGEHAWTVALQARDVLVFRNAAGETAQLPVALARLLARHAALDVEVIEDDEEDEIVFLGPDDEDLARLPRSLWVSLDRALASWTGTSATRAASPRPPSLPRVDGRAPAPPDRAAPGAAAVSPSASAPSDSDATSTTPETPTRPARRAPRPARAGGAA